MHAHIQIQGQKLRYRHCKTDMRKYSFSNSVVEHWNLWPQEIKNAKTLNTFKNRSNNYPKLQEKFHEFDER